MPSSLLRRLSAYRRADLVLLSLLIATISIFKAARPFETDPFWQARAGADFLLGAPLVGPDYWSFAPVSGDFYPNSPGWNVVLSFAFTRLSYFGLFLLATASVAFLLAMVAVLARRFGASYSLISLSLLVLYVPASSVLTARATVPAQALFLVGVLLVLLCASKLTAAPAAFFPAAAVFGVSFLVLAATLSWVHLSSLMYLAFLFLVSLFAFLSLRLLPFIRRVGLLVLSFVSLALGSLLGPYSLSTSLDRARATSDAASGLASEWVPALSPLWPFWAYVAMLVAVAAFALSVWHVARLPRSGPVFAVCAALVFVSGIMLAASMFLGVRFLGPFVLSFAPLLAPAFISLRTELSKRPGRFAVAAAPRLADGYWRMVLSLALVFLFPLVLLVSFSSSPARPADADAVSALPSMCSLFAADSASTILTRPDVRVFFDGRLDYWGRDRVLEFAQFASGASPGGDLLPAGTSCVLLPAADGLYSRLAFLLDNSNVWVRVFDDGEFAVWAPSRV